ncbi:MAG: pyridoxamine 5'-phosphate oxidase family protein [Actinomycetota bacterium]|nr:pyridoxamine 5'-phosphate oxidase family protein [Actinomycetota bacterium]
MDAAAYPAIPKTTPTRHAERACYDRQTVHAVLDQALVCHLSYICDGRPVLIPTIHARIGERLYLHGSKGAALSRAATDSGLAVCVAATVVDGLVPARSAFQHSMNYRSVVLHGTAHLVADDAERARALEAVVDHVWPGRSRACRAPSAEELRATSVLAVGLLEVSAKCRAGDPVDKPEDLNGSWWAGVVPVHDTYGDPEPAANLGPDRPAPGARAA